MLKSIGIRTAMENLIIYLFYGFFATTFIAVFYGLESDLPDVVVATLEGPISIYTFGWLSLFGLLSLAAVTKLGSQPCSFDTRTPKSVFFFALPICEAAITLGIVIGGTLLGIAICSHLFFKLSVVDISIYPQFYALSAIIFLITYPVIYFTIAFIDTKRSIYFWLNGTATLYLFFVVALFYYTLPIKNAEAVGALAIILIIVYATYAYPKLAKTNS